MNLFGSTSSILRTSLPNEPHHGIEKWQLCQALYDGLEYQMKTLLESMCKGGFLKENEDEEWLLYEDLADKTIPMGTNSKKI